MVKRFPRFAVVGLFLLNAASRAADFPLDGNWKLAYHTSAAVEATNWLIQFESKDGKTVGKIVSSHPRLAAVTLQEVQVTGDQIRLVLKAPSGNQTFEGILAPTKKDAILGAFDDDRRLYPSALKRTTQTQLEEPDYIQRRKLPETIQSVLNLQTKSTRLRTEAMKSKDEAERKKLLQDSAAAAKEAETELPKLHAQVVAQHPKDLAAFESAFFLIRGADHAKASAEQVGAWANVMTAAAEPYGPRWRNECSLQVAEALATQGKLYAPIALEHALKSDKQLKPTDPAERHARVLKALRTSQELLGQSDAAKKTQARLDKVEEILDQEYYAKVPPLKTERFSGRKNASDRAVVMELFTGAQCPPCVAADVAFDALAKTYDSKDLILLQHHLHIPGPDPLTNADTEARWNAYRKSFQSDLRGTPSTLFNGNPKASGGGLLINAEKKLKEYREVIDEMLETPAEVQLRANASRYGDRIEIKVDVTDVKKPSDTLKLFVFLVEENVRYVGGNKLRFHHYVVRAMPSGAQGVDLPGKDKPYTTSVDLGELRGKLNAYLDEYAKKRTFPSSERPMHFKNLKVVALVQNDETKEILQGTVADLKDQRAQR